MLEEFSRSCHGKRERGDEVGPGIDSDLHAPYLGAKIAT